ncbi:CDP-alcohol phosphatidyltransferase family protein [Cellulomonas endophytica]|uniref:CDP-alcohol phosphatidyltransferase family protein n=1 Tax=Cellulomonas endophytica TaxID=2494735 RepID=UPI00196A4C0E|nr:CDP-alcohol phosphatidyltransferase family protein [Cellulomonas endophytica]
MAQGRDDRCGLRGCACEDRRTLRTAANAVTLARTVGSLALVVPAAALRSWPLLVLAYAVYWIGDVADGAVARRRGEETRVGAVLDVVCDRVNTVPCVLLVAALVPAPWPVAVFLVQFAVVDLVLSLLPLRWPVLSPNYFALVDPLVHRLNWHPAAKATNTMLLVLLVVLVPDQRPAVAVATTVLLVKAFSLARVVRLLRDPATAPPRRPARAHLGTGGRPASVPARAADPGAVTAPAAG